MTTDSKHNTNRDLNFKQLSFASKDVLIHELVRAYDYKLLYFVNLAASQHC